MRCEPRRGAHTRSGHRRRPHPALPPAPALRGPLARLHFGVGHVRVAGDAEAGVVQQHGLEGGLALGGMRVGQGVEAASARGGGWGGRGRAGRRGRRAPGAALVGGPGSEAHEPGAGRPSSTEARPRLLCALPLAPPARAPAPSSPWSCPTRRRARARRLGPRPRRAAQGASHWMSAVSGAPWPPPAWLGPPRHLWSPRAGRSREQGGVGALKRGVGLLGGQAAGGRQQAAGGRWQAAGGGQRGTARRGAARRGAAQQRRVGRRCGGSSGRRARLSARTFSAAAW
jgi:hypothetical protein